MADIRKDFDSDVNNTGIEERDIRTSTKGRRNTKKYKTDKRICK